MGFKSVGELKNENRVVVKAKDLAVGESVEGYLMKLYENESSKFPGTISINVLLSDGNGNETLVYGTGNIKYLKKDLDDAGVETGTKIRINRVAIPSGSNYKTYFTTDVNRDDVLNVPTEEM